MIEVKNLVKKYGSRRALKSISFSAGEGEVLGFLGPNGAGKSTTMNILTGYLSSTQGTVKIAGFDILEEPMKAKQKIGYLPEIPPLYPDMTVRSYLDFIYGLKKVKIPKKSHIQDVIAKVKLEQVADRVIKNLSKGYKQRVGLAQALIGDPPVLILDEPTVGLDPKQIIEIRDLITDLKEHRTVILSSHILPEVQALCDRILVINQGKLVADDTTENLTNGIEKNNIFYGLIEGDEQNTLDLVRTIDGVVGVTSNKQKEPGVYEYQIEANPQTDIRRPLFYVLSQHGLPLLGLRQGKLTLEEIFLKLTQEPEPIKRAKTDGGEE